MTNELAMIVMADVGYFFALSYIFFLTLVRYIS